MVKDFEKEVEELVLALSVLQKLVKIRNALDESEECCDNEEENEDDECEIVKSLRKDYDEYTTWTFGIPNGKRISKKRGIAIWKELHPDIPIPRILLTEKKLPHPLVEIALFLDTYPSFLAEKNKCTG